jgi:hypothetical protein
MRTKTLLLAAALTAAGIASSLAQSNVYSINVVGYVNTILPPGYSIIANPLNAGATGNTVSNLFKNLVDNQGGAGSWVLTWNGTGTVLNQNDDLSGTWALPNDVLAPGEGFYFRNNSGSPKTNTFVGEVKQGALSVSLPTVYSLVASPVPQQGFVMDLGVNAIPADSVGLGVAGGAVSFSQYDDLALTWGPIAGRTVSSTRGPQVNVGEGFFYRKAPGSTATFTRNFTVQ